MPRIKPLGINIKDNDRDVLDGFLQESINIQWRDGAFKPIPDRIISEINVSGYKNIILHKVGDENQINVLGFNEGGTGTFLAFNVANYLGGNPIGGSILEWFGTITNGVYSTKTTTQIAFVKTPGMSFTILNGLIYFMGNGSSTTEQYYAKIEYDEALEAYNVYDMYKWKELIPYYPLQGNIIFTCLKDSYYILSSCGMILYRFALVLKSGEIVLHSPIYGATMFGLNRSATIIEKDDIIENIHTVISLNLDFLDDNLYSEEISAINVYASTAFYKTGIIQSGGLPGTMPNPQLVFVPETNTAEKQAEEPFYLIKTISNPSSFKILLRVGYLDDDISFDFGTNFYDVDVSTIAAGEIMPVDNFTYHRIFGKIGSYNGRLDIIRPVTILSGGHTRALATEDALSYQGYSILTEDGSKTNIISAIDKYIDPIGGFLGSAISRGILSYPDYRASSVGIYFPPDAWGVGEAAKMAYNGSRKNNLHNLACCFGFTFMETITKINAATLIVDPEDADKLKATINYDCVFSYISYLGGTTEDLTLSVGKYNSENRVQFAEIGEFKVWPATNSYRIGEGKVMNLGTGSVNPSESQVISPIIIGTTDGVYTVNLDPMGNNFIASITKTKNIPFLSEEILEIDNNVLFVSDKGVMVFSNGDIQNLTEAYFPQQGNGDFPDPNTIFSGYDTLLTDFPSGDYEIDDIVTYLKGAKLAFDGRRNNIWCSNSSYDFSLVYNLETKMWGMATLVFSEKPELFSIITTAQGDIYSRYMVLSASSNNLLILSGEDPTKEVDFHIFTRAIKFGEADLFKVIRRIMIRTLLVRDSVDGYFSLGVWGQQEVNKYKKSIPIALKKDDRAIVFPNDIRCDIPISPRKGKYKSVAILLSGLALPESYISSFDFDISGIDNKKMR